MEKRERFSSRLGFILISAGCAIGLGNVWRFPYITGMYGGGAFVLIYLAFLIIFGLPIMVMEFTVGRASQKSIAQSFDVLEPKGSKWHWYKWFGMAGNYLLMMFYTTIGGWMLLYFYKMLTGQFAGQTAAEISTDFSTMLTDPGLMTFCMALVVCICFGICALGLEKGVERITKVMMLMLLFLMMVLAVNSFFLEGGEAGLAFYLKPDWDKLMEAGIGEVIFAAMGQAFFTLSIGIGSMAIFGSYIGKERSMTGEAINIAVLDTFVALMAGMIIFPACFAFGVEVSAGPSLIFITLPNVFAHMAGGQFWGSLFFLFMSFAAISTIVAVFENIISFGMDLGGWSRKKSVIINLIAILLLSLPCVLGFNLWSGFAPFGAGTNILDLEDFIVSNNLLPLGSLVYVLFCTRRYGWGYDNFINEANSGTGLKFPRALRFYVSYIIPILIIVIFIQGYWAKFFV